MRLFVIAGHNKNKPGARAYNGLYEHHYTLRAQGLMQQKHCMLQMEGSIMEDNRDQSLSQVIQFINDNSRPGDYGIDIHFNNNNPHATGSEGFLHPNTGRTNRKIASSIIRQGAEIIGIPVRRYLAKRDYKYPEESFLGSLAIIEKTRIPFFLYEPCFLNEKDLTKYLKVERQVWRMVIETYEENLKSF